MNILVSGAAGLYGLHTLEELSSRQDITRIYGMDNFSRGYPIDEERVSHLWGNRVLQLKQRYQDISVKEINSLNIDVVIHLAGYNSGKESMNTPEEYFQIMSMAPSINANTLRTKNRPFFIYASTVEVYGEPESLPVRENAVTLPQNIYAATKLAAEQHVMAVGKWFDYPVTSIRFTNTFGENHSIYGYTSVVSSFIDRALRNEPLIVYGTGEQTRDFLYVKDAAYALSLTLSHRKEAEGRIINIGSGEQISINKLANTIIKLTDSTSEILSLPCEKGKHNGFAISTERAGRILQWAPAYRLQEGLRRTINWHRGLSSI